MSAATLQLEEETMAPKTAKTSPVRLTEEAIKWARIASGYTGESMAEYVSRIVADHSKQDVERLHATIATPEQVAPKRKAGGK